MTTTETNARNEYANEDINLLEDQGVLAITHTLIGVIWAEFENGIYIMRDKMGEITFQSAVKAEAIEFVASKYSVA